MTYRYVISLWSEIDDKGWTFVEWLFGQTSYLPYVSTDQQSTFYQSLLFDSCTSVHMGYHGTEFVDQLCHIQTYDNQTFTITLNTGFVRSDGTPVTIDDVYFTYNSIIIGNARSLAIFNIYGDSKIEKISDTSLRLSFAKKSIDNKLFFTYHILPRHILQDKSFDFYKNNFAQNPIYTKCVHLKAQSTDINSLVLDLSNCTDTKLWFYQIKNITSFDAFQQDYALTKKTIVDAYLFDVWLEGYVPQPIITHAYTTLFFNTNSDKVRIRLRRSLAGLINNNFYTGWYEKFLWKDQWIFDNFSSTGGNVEDFLTRLTPDGNISTGELQESGVKALTGRIINFNEQNRRNAYYNNDKKYSIELHIAVSNSYNNIGIMYGDKDKWSINTYDKSKKTAQYTISTKDIVSGINTYTIYTKDKDKKINIGSITIYMLDKKDEAQTTGKPNTTITVIYQNNGQTQKVIQHLKDIFEGMHIDDFFVFEPMGSKVEMEAKLLSNEYDIALMPIDRWLRRDIGPMLKTDDPIVNPSQYVNPQFISLFEQYIESDQNNKVIDDQMTNIYTRDMPFMILGKQVDTVFVKADIYDTVFAKYTGYIFENTRRQQIYTTLSRIRSMHIDTENIWGIASFRSFIKNTLNRNTKESTGTTDTSNSDSWKVI